MLKHLLLHSQVKSFISSTAPQIVVILSCCLLSVQPLEHKKKTEPTMLEASHPAAIAPQTQTRASTVFLHFPN